MLIHAQENTISQSQLDSLSNKSDLKAEYRIDNVPIYKGCENKKDNAKKKQCMSDKISLLFQKNFNTTRHKNSKIDPGFKQVFVIFKIDKDGKVIDINSRAEDEFLEAEAKRVTNLIPQMIPGHMDGEAVIVPYAIPLKIDLIANFDDTPSTYPVFRGCDKESSNSALQNCSKEKIMNFIKMSFDIEMASRALPTEKSTQFLVEFNINKKGKVENINAKANHKAIAIEAINVAKRLPKFKTPGTLNGKPIDTPYKLLMTLYF